MRNVKRSKVTGGRSRCEFEPDGLPCGDPASCIMDLDDGLPPIAVCEKHALHFEYYADK